MKKYIELEKVKKLLVVSHTPSLEKVVISDYLNAWAIEVSEDAISRANAIKAVKNVSENYTGKGKRNYHPHIDFIIDALKHVEPSVIPQPKEGEWITSADGESSCSVCGASEEEFIYGTENWYGMGDSNYCSSCGAKMKG